MVMPIMIFVAWLVTISLVARAFYQYGRSVERLAWLMHTLGDADER